MEPTPLRFALVAESIDGAGVRVRRYRDSDVPAVRTGCDDPLTRQFLPMLPTPYTIEDARWWVTEGALAAFATGGGNFAIADPATDRLLGGIGITHQRDGAGEIGYWVAPWARRQGVATAATRTLTGYAFSAGYDRVQLRTEYENTVSQRVAISAGYSREGVQRCAAVGRDGTRHDLIVWSRVPGDPPGPSPRLLPDLPGGRLTDGVVTLEGLGPDDAADLYAIMVDPTAVAFSVPTVPRAPADLAQRCARAEADWLAGQAARCAIRDAATGAFAGEISIAYQEPRTNQALVGYGLGPAWRGRGFATRALRLISRWVLTETTVARLIAGVDVDNMASLRVLERTGFTREGVERGRLPRQDGGRADVISFALLRGDLRDSG